MREGDNTVSHVHICVMIEGVIGRKVECADIPMTQFFTEELLRGSHILRVRNGIEEKLAAFFKICFTVGRPDRNST